MFHLINMHATKARTEPGNTAGTQPGSPRSDAAPRSTLNLDGLTTEELATLYEAALIFEGK